METKAELKKRIVAEYVEKLEKDIKMKKSILADSNWASSGSEYHKRCRAEMQEEIRQATAYVKMLKTPTTL